MALVLTSAPTIEPISLDEAKAHLRIDEPDQDILISSLVTASRVHVEVALERRLVTQGWSYFLDSWPSESSLDLPLTPIQSLEYVRIYSDDDNFEVVEPDKYLVDTASMPARFVKRKNALLPDPQRCANGIEMSLIAGYGDSPSDIPRPILQALLLLISHWFENREIVILGQTAVEIPETAMGLLAPYKMVRL